MGDLLGRFKSAATKAGKQATAFGIEVGGQISQGSKELASGLKLESECQKAANTLATFLADPKHPESALNAVPKAVLSNAKGLAIFTVVKAGFVWSGRVGSGVAVARLPDGSWSAPSCIGVGGVGFGFQAGADISDFVVVLNNEDAVRAFSQGGNVTIGGNLSASAGPIGTGGSVDSALVRPTPLFTYSRNRGLYAGISLEGTVLIERKDANAAFYGCAIPAADLLAGKVPPPEAASPLYQVVEAAEAIDETGVPEQSYVPEKPIFDESQ